MSDLVGDGIKYSSSTKSVVVTVTGCGTNLTRITVGIQVAGGSFWGRYVKPNATMLVSQADFDAYKKRVDKGTGFALTLHLASDNTTILSYVYAGVTIPSKAWSLASSSETTSGSVAPTSRVNVVTGVEVSDEAETGTDR